MQLLLQYPRDSCRLPNACIPFQPSTGPKSCQSENNIEMSICTERRCKDRWLRTQQQKTYLRIIQCFLPVSGSVPQPTIETMWFVLCECESSVKTPPCQSTMGSALIVAVRMFSLLTTCVSFASKVPFLVHAELRFTYQQQDRVQSCVKFPKINEIEQMWYPQYQQ